MTTTRLHKMPTSSLVRSVAGAITADNLVINTTNYPYALGFNPDSRVGKIVVSWTSGGTVAPTDWLDLQVLIWDGLASSAGWTEGQRRNGVRHGELVEFDVAGASYVCIRIAAISCAAGTGLIVRAAQSDYLT